MDTVLHRYKVIKRKISEELADEVRALRDAGCTGGFMTWNGASDIDKYAEVISALS